MSVNKRLIGAGATDTGGGGGAITADSHFKAITYDGNGSSQTIGGLNFQPDFIWFKCRNTGGTDHNINDSARGVMKGLNPNTTAVEGNQSPLGVTSFDSSGFTVNDNSGGGAGVNGSGKTYIAWCWHGNAGTGVSDSNGTITSTVQVNDPAGFSMVKYTGNGSSGASIGHGLSAQPNMIISKSRDTTNDWMIFHSSLSTNNAIKLNSTNAAFDATAGTKGGGFSVDSTKMTVLSGTSNQDNNNKSGDDFIAYCFRDITGYQKIGSYTGDSGTSHSIDTGFKPAFLFIKRSDSGDNGLIFDSARDGTTDNNQVLFPNSGNAESNPNLGNGVDFTATGFTLKTTDSSVNNSSGTYLYWAIAGTYPSETPTVEESFSAENWGGSDYRKNIMNNFRAGLVITRAKGESHHWGWYDIVRGVGKWLITNSTGAENTGDYGPSAYNTNNTEFYGNHTPANSDYLNETYNGWFIKAGESTSSNSNGSITSTVSVNAAAGFSIINFTTPSTNNFSVGHGLSSAPELVIYKCTSQNSNWTVYDANLGATKYLLLNGNQGEQTSSLPFNDTAPTSTVLNLGSATVWWATNANYVAYCFDSISSFSKFGTYTGTGSLQTITTGFTPDFVVIKKTNADGEDWAVFSSYDLGMSLNSFNKTQSQQAFNNSTMFSQSTGFQVPSSSGMTNGSGQTYSYWAMKKNVTQDDTTQYNFNVKLYDGNGSADHYIDGFDFRPDLVIVKPYNATGQWSWFDSVRGAGNRLDSTTNSSATQNGATLQSFKFDGYTFGNESGNNTGEGNVAYAWRAGRTWLVNNDGGRTSLTNVNQSAGLSIVRYIASGTTTTIGHGLGSTPKFIIAKTSNQGYDWLVYHTSVGNSSALQLHTDAAAASNSFMNNTSPTSTVFTAAGGNNLNYQSGNEIIAYCFDDVSGKRKFGSFTGNGSTQSITGLGFQPDFVMIKGISSGGNGGWYVFDSVQGVQKYLRFNLTNARATGAASTLTSFDSDGFTLGNDGVLNGNTYTYIYWAEKIH